MQNPSVRTQFSLEGHYIMSGTVDPTVSPGIEAQAGTIYNQVSADPSVTSPIGLWQKQNNGLSTNWLPIGGGSSSPISDYKDPVKAVSVADIVIAAPVTNIIDGVALANGDRVLLKDQTLPAENGIYDFNGIGVPMIRSSDADTDAEVTQGLFTYTLGGTVNEDTGWLLTTPNPISLGVTALTFVELTLGVTQVAPIGSLGQSVDGLTVNNNSIAAQIFDSTTPGMVPASGGLSTEYLSADGTFSVPAGGGITELTGDVTAGPGAGSQAATIAAGAVNNSKLADVATATFKGRVSPGVGSPEELTVAQATALLDVMTPALKGLVPVSGGGTTTFLRADGNFAVPGGSGVTSVGALNSQPASADGATIVGTVISFREAGPFSPGLMTDSNQNFNGSKTFREPVRSVIQAGAAPAPAGGTACIYADNLDTGSPNPLTGVFYQKDGTGNERIINGIIQDAGVDSVRAPQFINFIGATVAPSGLGVDVTVSGGGGITELTGDVTAGPGVGSQATTIAAGAVSNSKLANVATATFKGRVSPGVGSPEELTVAQATALLDVMTPALKGLVPVSGGGTTTFLRADGNFAVPPGTSGATWLKEDFVGAGPYVLANTPLAFSVDVIIEGAAPTLEGAGFDYQIAALTVTLEPATAALVGVADRVQIKYQY